MENEFECLVVRGGHGGHFAEKFVKKYCPQPQLSRLPRRALAVVIRQRHTIISAKISKRRFNHKNLSSPRVFELEP